MQSEKLTAEFDEAMFDIYKRALTEAGYNASIFLSMLNDRGGIATARYLIHASAVSSGYTALWERKRLDLTVEAMILRRSECQALFTQDELSICRVRLAEYGYAS